MILTSEEWGVVALSLKVSLTSVVFSLPFAVLVAWILARKTFRGKILLTSLVHLPLVMPPVVMGYLLLITMGRHGVLGEPLFRLTGFSFGFNWMGAALASAIMAFPLMLRSIQSAIASVDGGLEDAARTLGSSPLRVFFTITLPLSYPGLLAGAILAFARSLGEFGATITFVSNIPSLTQTLPLALYSATQSIGGEMQAFRLCLIALALCFVSLLISEWLIRRNEKRLQG